MSYEEFKGQLDRIEEKLDSHLERISKAETNIQWIQGHIKIAVLLGISGVAGMVASLWKNISGQ